MKKTEQYKLLHKLLTEYEKIALNSLEKSHIEINMHYFNGKATAFRQARELLEGFSKDGI